MTNQFEMIDHTFLFDFGPNAMYQLHFLDQEHLDVTVVANGEWRVLRDRQPVRHGKLRANVAACVAGNQGLIFKPEKETFFELTTERLPNSGARFEAGNPS
jgi:hypothetical protein